MNGPLAIARGAAFDAPAVASGELGRSALDACFLGPYGENDPARPRLLAA
jgi:hypothetical protein